MSQSCVLYGHVWNKLFNPFIFAILYNIINRAIFSSLPQVYSFKKLMHYISIFKWKNCDVQLSFHKIYFKIVRLILKIIFDNILNLLFDRFWFFAFNWKKWNYCNICFYYWRKVTPLSDRLYHSFWEFYFLKGMDEIKNGYFKYLQPCQKLQEVLYMPIKQEENETPCANKNCSRLWWNRN